MIVYRLTQSKYKDDLEGNGAYIYGGRWNSDKQYVLYTAESIALATLELVVNIVPALYTVSFHLLKIELPDDRKHFGTIKAASLPNNWKQNIEVTKWIGDEFVKHNSLLFLKIPSSIIEEENNIIINPFQTDKKKIKLLECKKFNLDNRLLK